MIDKRILLDHARLYCVLDAGVVAYDQLFDILDRSAEEGVDIFQIRDKNGSNEDIEKFARKAMQRLNGRCLFIVNDRVEVALAVGADGVHVGQDDDRVETVRSRVGNQFIIGTSCQTLAQAQEAQACGADYIGFGSVFKTQTKPDRNPMDLRVLRDVLQKIAIPVFPIGGITLENCDQIKQVGARRLAVTREICLAGDVEHVTQALRKKLISIER